MRPGSAGSAHAALRRAVGMAACLPFVAAAAVGCQSGGSSGPDSSSTTTPATDDLEGSIAVAGTAAQVGHYEAWHAEFEVRHPDARVAFEPVSRDEAIRRFADGRAEIVATDRPLTARERRRAATACATGGLVEVPVTVQPVHLITSVPTRRRVALSPETVAAIASGRTTRWDAAQVRADNPGTRMPATPIVATYRSDPNPLSASMSELLRRADPVGWPYSAGAGWPVGVGRGAKGNVGVRQSVFRYPGSLGWVSDRGSAHVDRVDLRIDGRAVPPSAAASLRSLAVTRSGGLVTARPRVGHPPAGSYPFVVVGHQATCAAPEAPGTATVARAWLGYVLTSAGQRAVVRETGSVALPSRVRTPARAAVGTIREPVTPTR